MTHSLSKIWVSYSVSILIFAFSIWLAFSGIAKNNPAIYTGIIYDLVLTTPVALYLLSGRQVSRWVLSLFVTTGILLAYWIIPTEHQFHLGLLRFFLLPAVEFVLIASAFYYTYTAIRSLKQANKEIRLDYYTLLQQNLSKIVGSERLGKILGSEVAMCYYAFFCWKKRELHQNELSYHKNTGVIVLLWTVLMLVLIETTAVHFLLERWSVWLAWLLTGLSLYTFLMLLGHINAVVYRPHAVFENRIELKLGIFASTNIFWENIEKIAYSSKDINPNLKAVKFASLGDLEMHNVIFYFKEPQTIEYLYGIKKNTTILLCQIDEVERLKTLIPTQD